MSKRADLPELDADRAAAELCKRYLSEFVKEFWDVIIAEELVWNWHMDVLCDEVQAVYERVFMRYNEDGEPIGRQPKEYDLIINIPPGTSKSTIVSVMAPVWGWVRDQTLRHITGSYSGSLSTELATKSRDILKSPKFRTYFPDVILKPDEDGKTNYKTTRNGQRFATSVGGSATGIHAHIITIDDPLNPKQAASQVEVKSANDWFDNTLSTRKVDKAVTPLILIMQRLAVNDPTGYLTDKKLAIRWICLPGSISDNVKPAALKVHYVDGLLDRARLSKKVLDEMKVSLGSAQYAGQVDQSPTPLGGLIWKKWLIEVPDDVFPSPELMQKYGTDWDLAYTKDDDNSASACITAGLINGKRYIDRVDWDWLEFPQLIAWMKMKPAPHFIEAKASGKSAKQTLSKSGIAAIEVTVRGGDKIARANMATPDAEAGLVYIRQSQADKLYNDSKQGILFFPRAQCTDVADALAQSLQRLGAGSRIVTGAADFASESDPMEWDEDEDL